MHSQSNVLVGTIGRSVIAEPGPVPSGQLAGHRPPSIADSKACSTLAARYALAGRELLVEVGLDGQTRLHTIHHGRVVPLSGLGAALAFLAQIGGVHA